MTQSEVDLLNAHSADIINFLNHGGGLYAMAEGGLASRFGFLPFIVSSVPRNDSEAGNTLTPFGASLGLTNSDINGNFSHNVFTSTGGLNVVDADPIGEILSLAGRGKVTSGGVGSVIITGQFTHFTQGTTQVNFGAGITVGVVAVADETHLTAQITIAPTAAPGGRTVTATTGAEVASLDNGFTVLAPPVITQVNPTTGQQGKRDLSIAITGQNTHFVQGTTVANFGVGITVSSLNISSAATATAVLNIDPAATVGPRDITLTTGTEAATLVGGFTVQPSSPSITSVSPNSGPQGGSGPVSIVGQNTHFAQGVTQLDFGPGITVSNINVPCATCLTATVAIDLSAAVGSRTVTASTGGEVATLANGFTVTQVNTTPILTSIVPAGGLQGQSLSVAITGQGTHFVQGTTTANFGPGVTVSSLTVNSSTSATTVLNIDSAAATGPRVVTMTTGSETVMLANGFKVVALGQPTAIDIEFNQDITTAGAIINVSATPRDANGNAVPGTPACALSFNEATASGTVPTVGATSIATSSDTRGIYTLTCTLSIYSLTASKMFSVIPPAGPGTTQPGLFATFSNSINSATKTTSAIVAALQANDSSEVNALLTQLRATRDAVDYDALDRSTPFAPEAGFPASPDQLPSFGINPSPQDSNVGPYLNNLIAQLNSLTTFLQNHPLATLSAADQTTYNQLQSRLSTLVSQLGTLDPSAYGVVANEGIWNLLGADAVPQYFQALANATDQLLVANGYTGIAKPAVLSSSETSSSMIRLDVNARDIHPEFFGVSLEDLTLATSLQLQLIDRIYTPYFQYLIRAEYILLAQNAFQAFKGGLTLDGIITGASLSFNIFHAAGSIIESSVVNLIPKRNDVYLVGPDQEQKVATPLANLITNPPKNANELFKAFQDIKDALSPQSYQQAHQLPDSTTDFCILGNSPPCNQAVYSNGFNSVYAAGGLPLPAPVLILVHNLDGSQAKNGLWGSGVFNFLPSN